MVDVILVPLAALLDHAELAARIVGAQHAHFRGVLGGDRQHEEGFAAGVVHADVVELVGFLVDELRGRLERVAVQPVAALGGLVLLHVEERAAVGGPRDRGHALGALAQHASALQVLHLQRVLAKAGEIHRVGELRAVGTHVHGAHRRVLVALGELVHVEQHLFRGVHRALAAAVDRILQALDLALVIPVAALAVRHALVGFLDAREDLLVEPVAEAFERLHRLLRVAVLRFEVRDDFRIVLVAQPEVVVDAAVAELRHHLGLALRHRRGERFGGLGDDGKGEWQEHGGEERLRARHRESCWPKWEIIRGKGQRPAGGAVIPGRALCTMPRRRTTMTLKIIAAILAALALPALAETAPARADARPAPVAQSQAGKPKAADTATPREKARAAKAQKKKNRQVARQKNDSQKKAPAS
jgi:hypothetical protein